MDFTLSFSAKNANFAHNVSRTLEKLSKVLLFLLFYLQIISLSAQEQLTAMTQNVVNASYPSNFFLYKDRLLFLATTASQGRELWITDGTPNGTMMVKDINLGLPTSGIVTFTLFKEKVYFFADNTANGYQLWVTDGTPDGTRMITTSIVNLVRDIVADQNYIYFLRKESATKLELWKSDGTTPGTTMVKGNIDVWNDPGNLISANGFIYFTCQPYGSNETRLWRSDGTNDGTLPVSALLDGNGAHMGGTSHPSQFIEYNGSLYFIARGLFSGNESGLMKSNTAGETLPVKSMVSGLVNYGEAFVHNGKMYFTFFDLAINRLFIWESDGTEANTKLIFDNSYAHYFSPSRVLADGNNFYFTVGNSSSGTTLARFDLQNKTLNPIKDIAGIISKPFMFSKDFSLDYIVKGTTGVMYVGSIAMDYNAPELWLSDGTAGGTLKVTNVIGAHSVISFGNLEFLSGYSIEGYELWSSAGTPSSTSLFKDLNVGKQGMSSYVLAANKNMALFPGQDESHGLEPWVTDGTASGTKFLKDIAPGATQANYSNITPSENGFFFNGFSSGVYQTYQSDGTETGTKTLPGIPQSMFYTSVKTYDGKTFYYAVYRTDQSMSLYKHIIGQVAPVEIKNFGFNSSNVGFNIREMVVTASSVYLLVDGVGGDLWKSDGTPQGTTKLADFWEAKNLTLANNIVFFTANVAYSDPFELYKSDGTSGGTVIVKDLNGVKSPDPLELTAFGSKLAFTAIDATSGREVWITDGTANGTMMLKDSYVGDVGGVLNAGFAVDGNTLYFAANDGTHGSELWKSDGTSENTTMFKDLSPGIDGSNPNELKVYDGVLYFSAYTPDAGFEVWSSDGTAENTTMLVDVLPGTQYSNPSHFVKLDDYLVFYALTPEIGMQLWSYEVDDPGDNVTGIEESNSFSIYPNPSNGLFRMKRNGVQTNATVEIFSLDGRRIGKMNFDGEDSMIDITQNPPGMYVIKIIEGQTCTTTKVNKF